MSKITVNMLSSAEMVEGQGVGSAYLELINLLKTDGKDDFNIQINKGINHCDIIHAHTVEPINYVKMRLSKKTTIAYVHFLPDTLDGSIRLPKMLLRLFKRYLIRFYKNADHLIVVNPSFKKEMVESGLIESKITYIPNFVSKEEFYPQTLTEKASTRQKYGLSEDDFVVLGAGQVQTRKGVMDFVKVAESLPDIQFVWAGGFSFGPITDGHEALKKVMENPPKNVTFLGIVPREDMNDLFNAADLLFVPSYNELFPMTILEAISADTPILLRDIELYEDILFKKYLAGKDNEEFKHLITNLKEDSELYQEQVKIAQEISAYYSKENVYQLWKSFYQTIIE